MEFGTDRFSEEDNAAVQGHDTPSPAMPYGLSDAKEMANVVTVCLESENYADMAKQLETISSNGESKEDYVFEHPSVVSAFFAITTCVAISLLFLYFIVIGLVTVISSAKFFVLGIIFLGISIIILFLNIQLITKFVSNIKYKTRFDVYDELLGYKGLEIIDDIALCAKQSKATVIKDLHKAVKKKLIPQGHFSRNNLVFMVSDKVYDRYMEKPAAYDRYFKHLAAERKLAASRSKEMAELMEFGENYIKKLNDFASLVKDKAIVRKIERIKNVVSMIFHEIDVNPSQAASLGMFVNYYLPTTEKLIDTYIAISEKKVSVSNLTTAKKEIEVALDTIVGAFERILERLYEEYEMGIVSEIDAMELVMKQEGLHA